MEGVSTNPGPLRANLYTMEGHNSLNTKSGIQVACRDDEGEVVRHTQAACSSPLGVTSQRCVSTLDQSWQLAEVTSNVMASKFRIQSLCDRLPREMASPSPTHSSVHVCVHVCCLCTCCASSLQDIVSMWPGCLYMANFHS